MMMKKVYICAPLWGDVSKNLESAKRYALYALKCGTAPVVPHFYALCLSGDLPQDRELGMAAGMSLLWFCDELWVFGDEMTVGMQRELEFCRSLNIKIRKIKDNEINKKLGGNCK